MTRTAKIGLETGPQGYGQIPTLTELRFKVYNAEPQAVCTSSSLLADATTCAVTLPDISATSSDFDKNEGDTVSKKTIVRFPSQPIQLEFPHLPVTVECHARRLCCQCASPLFGTCAIWTDQGSDLTPEGNRDCT